MREKCIQLDQLEELIKILVAYELDIDFKKPIFEITKYVRTLGYYLFNY